MWNSDPELYRGKFYARKGGGASTKRRSLGTDKLDVARQRLNDLCRFDKVQPTMISEIFELYRLEKEDAHETLKYIWRGLAPYFGHLRPDQVTRQLCDDYKRKRGVGDGTIIRELGALRASLKLFDPNTPARFKFPKAPPPKNRYLSREEAARLIGACEQPHIRLFIILALCTGARKSALLQLTWDRVDMKRGQIDLGIGEANKGRAILPLNETAKLELQKAYPARLTSRVIEYNGKAVKDIKRGFATTAREAGIEDIYPHALRHTAAVWMAESGVPMSEIAQYLGHSSTRVTERVYARYSAGYLKKAAASLEMSSIEPMPLSSDALTNTANPLKEMARVTRLELAASAVTEPQPPVQRSILLSKLFNRHPFRVI